MHTMFLVIRRHGLNTIVGVKADLPFRLKILLDCQSMRRLVNCAHD